MYQVLVVTQLRYLLQRFFMQEDARTCLFHLKHELSDDRKLLLPRNYTGGDMTHNSEKVHSIQDNIFIYRDA